MANDSIGDNESLTLRCLPCAAILLDESPRQVPQHPPLAMSLLKHPAAVGPELVVWHCCQQSHDALGSNLTGHNPKQSFACPAWSGLPQIGSTAAWTPRHRSDLSGAIACKALSSCHSTRVSFHLQHYYQLGAMSIPLERHSATLAQPYKAAGTLQ